MDNSRFGTEVRQLRIEHGISIRQFCRTMEVDPSNWSKVERGILPPTMGEEFYERLANELGLPLNSEKITSLRDLAASESGRIPADLAQDPEVSSLMPLFFRTLRNERPTRQELIETLSLIQSSFRSINEPSSSTHEESIDS